MSNNAIRGGTAPVPRRYKRIALSMVPGSGPSPHHRRFPRRGRYRPDRQSPQNMKAILPSGIADLAAMNGVCSAFLSAPTWPGAAFQAAALSKGARVEIEAIAAK